MPNFLIQIEQEVVDEFQNIKLQLTINQKLKNNACNSKEKHEEIP